MTYVLSTDLELTEDEFIAIDEAFDFSTAMGTEGDMPLQDAKLQQAKLLLAALSEKCDKVEPFIHDRLLLAAIRCGASADDVFENGHLFDLKEILSEIISNLAKRPGRPEQSVLHQLAAIELLKLRKSKGLPIDIGAKGSHSREGDGRHFSPPVRYVAYYLAEIDPSWLSANEKQNGRALGYLNKTHNLLRSMRDRKLIPIDQNAS